MEVVKDFIFLGSKITTDGDSSQEIKRRLLLGRKAMANLDSILKSRDITLPTKVHMVKAMVFPVTSDKWTTECFFVLNKDKAVCLIRLETVSVLKEYNVKRHFESCHKSYSIYQGEQNSFRKHVEENPLTVRASRHVAKCTAESGGPFTDGEVVKKCMVRVIGEMCPDEVSCVSCVCLSASTITRHVDELGEELHKSLIFSSSSSPNCVHKLSLQSLKGTISTENIFLKVCGSVENLALS
ncbi:EPM2A-interacting protein 1 [Varanus komodoensis]|nr:EPM2A-interacting protein 1 [Varanus komodoensis]